MNFTPYHEPWTASATCRSVGGDAFYPESDASHEDWDYLRSVCLTRCPVLANCREWVMRVELGQGYKARYGVAAGMSPLERKKYERKWIAEQEAVA